MIVSAISLWREFKLNTPLGASEWGIEKRKGMVFSHVSYSGHTSEAGDGAVRIYGKFARPLKAGKYPVVLLLPDAGKPLDEELLQYFVDRGYAVLMPDYSGKMQGDGDNVFRTVYPPSLMHGNFEQSRGLYDLSMLEVTETTWFEWTYVALYSLEYLKSREDVGNIGVVGIRKGGELAWQVMLSPAVKCGVAVNAIGWRSFQSLAKFGDNVAHDLSNDTHRYIAAIEAQSYAPYVKCPVLMLCALRDDSFDCDRAYDTYSRIGNTDGNVLVYSADSGACIGARGLTDLDLFLEKNLKDRAIYVPDTLNVALKETSEGIQVLVEGDDEGILDEAGVFYAEADVTTKSDYREWRRVYKVDGKSVKDGKFSCKIKPFEGATAAFVYAYAKYINGFTVMSKITAKKFLGANPRAVKSRRLFTGKELDCFGVAQYEDYSIGEIFLEKEAAPKITYGYGNITGAYSVGGIKTYKISSPEYIPDENAFLKFDVYFQTDEELKISVESADTRKKGERYTCVVPVKGGGKFKRIILKAADFKGERFGSSLQNFSDGRALLFSCENENSEFAVTNIIWL
ncbi:MAG: dienelactone hydrolase family protein [Clostridia bacterium]|nr:dienelactone hydrolase family protein [Clostridia bacterium]